MNIRIRKETIKPMLELCKSSNNNEMDRMSLEKILDELLVHDDYIVEMERYDCAGGPRGTFTLEDYKNLFFNYKTMVVEDIENQRMKDKLEIFRHFMNNHNEYLEGINRLCNFDNDKIYDALKWTTYGLPYSIELDDIEIIISIGLGSSGAWAYKNYSFYDAVLFSKNYDEEMFLNTVAHELHHIGFSKLFSDETIERMSPEEYFIILFAYEGLATKLCNNYNGVLTNNIYDIRINKGVDNYSLNHFKNNFDSIYSTFKNDINDIRNGVHKNNKDIMNMFVNKWMSLKTNSKNDTNDLALSMNYFIGAEIWGLVHDTLGIDEVFKCLEEPKHFIESLNRALQSINKSELKI